MALECIETKVYTYICIKEQRKLEKVDRFRLMDLGLQFVDVYSKRHLCTLRVLSEKVNILSSIGILVS